MWWFLKLIIITVNSHMGLFTIFITLKLAISDTPSLRILNEYFLIFVWAVTFSGYPPTLFNAMKFMNGPITQNPFEGNSLMLYFLEHQLNRLELNAKIFIMRSFRHSFSPSIMYINIIFFIQNGACIFMQIKDSCNTCEATLRRSVNNDPKTHLNLTNSSKALSRYTGGE